MARHIRLPGRSIAITLLTLVVARAGTRVIYAIDPFAGCTNNAINTAIGCIQADDAGGFAQYLLRIGIGMGGGIAFLLIIFGGFQILTSAGNPERLNEGKELVSSAIAGLLMVIFSIFLLKIIGVDILGIPGFGP